MGPSGCGKTTLLSLLAKRNKIAPSRESEIYVNKLTYTSEDFCQFGAYVQQDDVLYTYMTPKELFIFACQMRTNLTFSEIRARVSSLLSILSLQACKNTLIGSVAVKGISGGERKRTSIGYELITNPSLLILDEPTSGLDSSTALKVIEILRKECKRGMSIITSIH